MSPPPLPSPRLPSPGAGSLLVVAFLATGILCWPGPSPAQEPYSIRCGAGVHEDRRTGLVALPQGRLFCPLAADPKSEHSYLSYLTGDFASIGEPDDETNIGSVGIGDSFPLFRLTTAGPANGVQLDLSGGVFAQFNLDRPSFDLINADYLVGLPLTFRRGGFTSRLRVYHQSSHLGDEFLLARQPERLNVSFESLELLLSQEVGPLRVYGGGENFFRRRPTSGASRLAHMGAEVRPAEFGAGRLLAAVDVKVVEFVEWEVAWSARTGVEIVRIPTPGHPARALSILAEYYQGPAPYGQFFRDDIRFIGLGLHFSL